MTNSTATCTSFPDNPSQCDVIIAVRKASGAFSFVGCLFMIFIIWLFRRYVAFAQRLLLYLSIAALFDSIGYLMSSRIEDGPMCNFQGWWLTFFDWQVLLFVTCITFNLFMNVIRQTSTEKFEWLYLGIMWVVPLIISCIPFSGDHYGPAGAWCWIIEDIAWRIAIWYGPLIAIIAILIITYSYIIYVMSRKASSWEGTYDPDTQRQHSLLKEDIKPLRVYPFIYLALAVFPLINRIQNAFSPDYHVFALVLLSSISSPLHGAVNAIAFGMDKETFASLRPSRIKLAFESRRARQPIREYPYSYATFNTTTEELSSEEEMMVGSGGGERDIGDISRR